MTTMTTEAILANSRPSNVQVQNTTDPSLSNLDTGIPDPIASSFTDGIPTANSFLTRPLVSQVDEVDLSNKSSLSVSQLTSMACNILDTLAIRSGINEILSDADLLLANIIMFEELVIGTISGILSLLSNPCGNNNSIHSPTYNKSLILPTIELASDAIELAAFISNVGSLFSNTANFGSIAALVFSNTFPNLTDMNGNSILGIATDIALDVYNDITSNTNNVAPSVTITSGMDYATRQNLFNTTLALQIVNGMNPLVSQMITVPVYFNSSSRDKVILPLLNGVAQTGNTALVRTLVTAINAWNVNPNIIQTLINNAPNTTASLADINYLITQLGITITELYSMSGPCAMTYNNQPVWDISNINADQNGIASSLISPTTVKMAKAIAANMAA